jgi:hypothetical protein
MDTINTLTKTKLMGFLQCSKRLWLESYRKDLIRRSPEDEAKLALGRTLGETARELYPSGLLVGDVFHPAKALATTRQLLEREDSVTLFEPAFRHRGVLIRADVLVKEDSVSRLVEIKSSSHLKPGHIQDLAIQSWVIEGSRYPLESACVATISLSDSEPMKERLSFHELTEEVRSFYPDMDCWVSRALEILGGDMPAIEPGEQCLVPYPCPFREFCG